jgi:hypothetical protein
LQTSLAVFIPFCIASISKARACKTKIKGASLYIHGIYRPQQIFRHRERHQDALLLEKCEIFRLDERIAGEKAPLPTVDGPATALDWTAMVRASFNRCFLRFPGCSSPLAVSLRLVDMKAINRSHITCTRMASTLRTARCTTLRVSRPLYPHSRFISTSRPCRNEQTPDIGVPATQKKPIGAFRGGSVSSILSFYSVPSSI